MVRAAQVVLITGASRGLGAATARELAERGHTVVAGMRRPEQDGPSVREGYASQIEAVHCDITDSASVESSVRFALEKHGRIDTLINNAGYGLYGPVEEVSDEEITAQFETNVTGTLRMTRAVLPSMRERREGRVIMVGSISSFALAPLSGMYSASKAALESASETLRYEVAHWGIEVGIVQPGVYSERFPRFAGAGEAFGGGRERVPADYRSGGEGALWGGGVATGAADDRVDDGGCGGDRAAVAAALADRRGRAAIAGVEAVAHG